MTNVLFLGRMYSDLQKTELLHYSKRGYEFAAQTFQESLLKGFEANNINVRVISVPSLSTYPFGYRRPLVKSCNFVFENKKLGYSFGYINLPFINRPLVKISDYIERWFLETEGDKAIVVYGMHTILLDSLQKVKEKHPEIKVCLIIPDLPEFMNANKYYKLLGLKKKDITRSYKLLTYVDCYTLLSKMMTERLPHQKPFTVVEGIWQNEISKQDIIKEINRTILYTGGLNKRYGIMDLVYAFSKINYDNYRLWICGNGDAVEEIKEQVKKDNRIIYLGMKPHNEILKLQQRATLLVNPRHSGETFTKYSFPSKTMEYMASGTPTLMSKLECIPDEYDQYLYYFDDESIEGMTKRMIEICETDEAILERKGKEACTFINEKKNAKVQVNKILNIL